MGLLQISNREVGVYHPRGARLVRATLSSLMQKKALVLSLGVRVAQRILDSLVLVQIREGQRIEVPNKVKMNIK